MRRQLNLLLLMHSGNCLGEIFKWANISALFVFYVKGIHSPRQEDNIYHSSTANKNKCAFMEYAE